MRITNGPRRSGLSNGAFDPFRQKCSRRSRAPWAPLRTATNVRTGRGRVFRNAEETPDVLLASACLPTLFQAVEIDGEAYWDGGYAGNPTIRWARGLRRVAASTGSARLIAGGPLYVPRLARWRALAYPH